MSNMIERVARALCAAYGREPDKLEPGNSVGDWEGQDGVLSNGDPAHFLWRAWVLQARAAIEAMRDEDEVTDGMLEAGRLALHAPENRHGAVLGAVFCAMIDAALQEKEAGE